MEDEKSVQLEFTPKVALFASTCLIDGFHPASLNNMHEGCKEIVFDGGDPNDGIVEVRMLLDMKAATRST